MLYTFWIAYLTITRREILRFSRIWVQTIVPPVVMVALYFIIFGNLIGQRIGEIQRDRQLCAHAALPCDAA